MFIRIAFLAISIILFNAIAIFIPKRLKAYEMFSASTFVMLLQVVTDVVLNLKYHLYGYFNPGIDLAYYITLLGIFPAFTIIMLNYFPFNKSIKSKVNYILTVTIFCLCFEFLSLKTRYLYYVSWTIWRSAIAYPIAIIVIALYLYVLRKLKK